MFIRGKISVEVEVLWKYTKHIKVIQCCYLVVGEQVLKIIIINTLLWLDDIKIHCDLLVTLFFLQQLN